MSAGDVTAKTSVGFPASVAPSPISVKIYGGFWEKKQVEIISPSSAQGGLMISIACEVDSLGIWAKLKDFSRGAKESSYLPLRVTLEGGKESKVYIKVADAAKKLLVSEEEIRANVKSGSAEFWSKRAVVVKTSVEVIHSKQKAGATKEAVYQEISGIYENALKGFKEGYLLESTLYTSESGKYTYFSEKGKVVVLRLLDVLPSGAFGDVHKVLDVSQSKILAVKKNREAFAKNTVAEAVMNYQKTHEDSHLAGIIRVREPQFFEEEIVFHEEYEFAPGGDISSTYKRYTEDQLKNLALVVLAAIEEFQGLEIGYVYSDLKPENILNVSSDKDHPKFKLTDFPESSPSIKDVKSFEASLRNNPLGMTSTSQCNTQQEIADIKILEELARRVRVKDTAIACCDEHLKKYSQPSSMHALLGNIKELLALDNPESAMEEIFKAYKQKNDEASVFQLGVILYEGVVSSFFPYVIREGRVFCDLGDFTKIEEYLEQSPKCSKEFKSLITKMLDPDPERRPSRASIIYSLERLGAFT